MQLASVLLTLAACEGDEAQLATGLAIGRPALCGQRFWQHHWDAAFLDATGHDIGSLLHSSFWLHCNGARNRTNEAQHCAHKHINRRDGRARGRARRRVSERRARPRRGDRRLPRARRGCRAAGRRRGAVGRRLVLRADARHEVETKKRALRFKGKRLARLRNRERRRAEQSCGDDGQGPGRLRGAPRPPRLGEDGAVTKRVLVHAVRPGRVARAPRRRAPRGDQGHGGLARADAPERHLARVFERAGRGRRAAPRVRAAAADRS